MADKKRRLLRYRRALFTGKKESSGKPRKSLEAYVEAAHSMFRSVKTRRAEFDGEFVLEVRYSKKRGPGLLVHLAAYTKSEHASVVPKVGANVDDAPVATAPPPANADYMDGDLMLLIAGDEVITCSNSLKERKFEEYCVEVFSKAGLDPVASMFSLAPIANANKVQLIEDEGVKSIELDVHSFEATADYVRQHSVRRTITEKIGEFLAAFADDDPDLREITDAENLSAQLVVSFDKRHHGGEVGKKRLTSIAKNLVDENAEGGFKIVTLKGNELGSHDIVLQKHANILASGKTVQRDAAFSELMQYYQELKDDGHTEQ